MNLHQEKLDEMRRDMLEEHELRTDWEYALDRFNDTQTTLCGLDAAVRTVQKAIDYLNFYGWGITYNELKDSF